MTKHVGKSDSYSDGKRLFQVKPQNSNLYVDPAEEECWCRDFSISMCWNKFHEMLCLGHLQSYIQEHLTGAYTKALSNTLASTKELQQSWKWKK